MQSRESRLTLVSLRLKIELFSIRIFQIYMVIINYFMLRSHQGRIKQSINLKSISNDEQPVQNLLLRQRSFDIHKINLNETSQNQSIKLANQIYKQHIQKNINSCQQRRHSQDKRQVNRNKKIKNFSKRFNKNDILNLIKQLKGQQQIRFNSNPQKINYKNERNYAEIKNEQTVYFPKKQKHLIKKSNTTPDKIDNVNKQLIRNKLLRKNQLQILKKNNHSSNITNNFRQSHSLDISLKLSQEYLQEYKSKIITNKKSSISKKKWLELSGNKIHNEDNIKDIKIESRPFYTRSERKVRSIERNTVQDNIFIHINAIPRQIEKVENRKSVLFNFTQKQKVSATQQPQSKEKKSNFISEKKGNQMDKLNTKNVSKNSWKQLTPWVDDFKQF